MWAATYTWYMLVNHDDSFLNPIWFYFDSDDYELDPELYYPQIYCTINLQQL